MSDSLNIIIESEYSEKEILYGIALYEIWKLFDL